MVFLLFLSICCNKGGADADRNAIAGETASVSYTEDYRPQFHFSPAENWMNDPNGLVYHNGE